jgi:hypothetical protein
MYIQISILIAFVLSIIAMLFVGDPSEEYWKAVGPHWDNILNNN